MIVSHSKLSTEFLLSQPAPFYAECFDYDSTEVEVCDVSIFVRFMTI